MNDVERNGDGQDVEFEEQEETGEVFDGQTEEDQDSSLIDQVILETERSGLRPHEELNWKQIEEASQGESQKIGLMGWFVRVGATTDKKTGKKTRGSYLKGQIVAVGQAKNKFGSVQPYVIVQGKNTTPAYRNNQGNLVPALNAVEGRWMVGIDSSLLELPTHKRDVVELEFQRKGQGGQRNVWAKVNCWPIG